MFPRRGLGKTAFAGATLLGAPLPLRHALAQAPANLKVALLLPTSGLQAQIGQACRRGADIANHVFAAMKMPAKLDTPHYDTAPHPHPPRTHAQNPLSP